MGPLSDVMVSLPGDFGKGRPGQDRPGQDRPGQVRGLRVSIGSLATVCCGKTRYAPRLFHPMLNKQGINVMAKMTIAPATPADYRRLAEKRLPRFLFDYIDGGSGTEQTLAANCRDFDHILLRQRVMRNVDNVDTTADLLGRSASMPLMLAPVGMAGMFARRGEALGASAARKAGIPFTLSTLGICPLTELNGPGREPVWFQLYMLRDRSAVESLLASARESGCDTLLFTVDLAVPGMRHRDTRSGMVGAKPLPMALAKAWQLATRPRWAVDVGLRGKPHTIGNLSHLVPDPTDLNAYKQWIESQFDPTVTWDDIAWLRSLWPGKLVIKGVLEPEDAEAAIAAGADGVIVSNHGGRQLDSVASSISKLPEVLRAVQGRAQVFLDGGVRSGQDVVKAVALGADGVLMGRPWVWALAGAGEAGLSDLLETLRREMQVAMALMGVSRLDELHPDLLEARPA